MDIQNNSLSIDGVKTAILRACRSVETNHDYLTGLDQAIGDGDLGITMKKIALALREYVASAQVEDIGHFLIGAGLVANRVGSSSFGTLMSTALMRAGMKVKGNSQMSIAHLSDILLAATSGIQERGKAKLNDKTVLDVLLPASDALKSALDSGVSLKDASVQMLEAAKRGRDSVTPLKSLIGRASWLGEQTKGKIDPGCAVAVIILEAISGHTNTGILRY
jgi:dihydroxyacetone kinase-like protein